MTEREFQKQLQNYRKTQIMPVELAVKLLTECGLECAYEEETRDALDMAIKALEQESETEQFARWVAREIFDDVWEYNKDAFAEIACRKLAKIGIVNAKGDTWEFVEPQESEQQ